MRTTSTTANNTNSSRSTPSPAPARARISSYCSAADASLFSYKSSSIWHRIQKQSYWWHAAFLLVLPGWLMILFVNTSCRFIEILPSIIDENGNLTTTDVFVPPISRGIHRGQILPSSSCQAWGLYSGEEEEDDLQLDTSMVITRVVSALSVATSLVVLTGLVWSCMVRPLSFVARWALLVFGSIVTAALQARSRLYVHGNLCENVHIDMMDENQDVVYDTCSSDTIAFHLTSATMLIFILAAVLIACDSPHRRVRHADNTTTTPPLESAVTSVQPQQQQPRQRSATIESFTSKRSCPGTPATNANFPEKEPV